MKYATTILLALLVSLAGMHFTLSAHYCSGEIAAVKFSLSGKTASCGMEADNENKTFPGTGISSRCCENNFMVYSVDNQYAPSQLHYKTTIQNPVKNFLITAVLPYHHIQQYFATFSPTDSPPGNCMTSAVRVTEICVFRI